MLGFWANGVVDYSRGYQDYQDPALGDASYGVETDILGSAGSAFSLGDGGSITVTMESVIINGSGDDFVVFENGFVWEGVYMELGFVEVSSNGTDFSRMLHCAATWSSLVRGVLLIRRISIIWLVTLKVVPGLICRI